MMACFMFSIVSSFPLGASGCVVRASVSLYHIV